MELGAKPPSARSDLAPGARDAGEPGAARASPAIRRPALLEWACFALALTAIAWFFAQLVRGVDAADFASVDTARVRLDTGPGWVDPRWEAIVAQRIAAFPPLEADDRAALDELAAALGGLGFLAEIGEPRVLWPDGVEIPVRFREPVACVRAGPAFLAVAAGGLVLDGRWASPPARDLGFLPLLVGVAGEPASVAEGDVLRSAALVDALAVAESMWRCLASDDLARLGRVAIDARRAREATVEEPGTVLWLEQGRRVYFGRSPNLDAPGELPVETKWRSVSRALRTLDPGEGALDWELADARWDRPELLPRGGFAEAPPRRRRD